MNNSQKTLENMNQAVWYNQWTLDKFKQYLKGEILEVGCGIGNFTNALTEYGNVWAIDIDKEYIIKTKQSADKRVEVGLGDIERGEYFFGDKKFDTIICLNVLEHVRNDNLALNNLSKLLKEKGRLVLLVPSHQFLFGEIDKSIGHFRRYSKSELAGKLERAGFKIIELRGLNFLGALGWFIAGKILKQNIIKEGNIKIFNLISPFVLPLEDLCKPPIGTSILTVAKKP